MTQRSLHNNTNVSLKPFGVFTGGWETTTNYLEASVYVNSTAYLAIGIQQSQDASGVAINTTYNYTPTDEVTIFNTAIGLPFFRIVVTNEANVSVAHMSVVSVLTAIPSGTTAPTAVTIDGVVDVSGNVVATNLITETLATRRVDFLVVGDWYRVASVGLTSGAEWQVLSGGTACVGGQSVPDVGRLFQAVAVGPAVAGGGTVYDIEYTEAVSATITNFPSFPAVQPVSGTVSLTDPTSVRIRDAYGDPILTTAGNLMVGISNIYTANPLHTIVDSGTVGIDSGNNTVKLDPFNATVTINDGNLPLPVNIFNGTMAGYANIPVNIDPTNNLVSVNDSSTITVSSITQALPSGTNNIGLVSLDGTGVGNLVQLSQTGSQNGVQVVYALPTGTNTIGKIILDTGTNSIGTVGIDTTLNTIKIDPSYNVVSGSVSITNSFKTNIFTYTSVGAGWVSDSVDLRVYSLADIYMLSAGSVTSALGMNFIGQYSPDNVNWFNSGNTLTLTATEPKGIAVGIITASPYIRLSADPANNAMDVATNVTMWIPTKSI